MKFMTPLQTRDALVREMREYASGKGWTQHIVTRWADRLAALPVGDGEPVAWRFKDAKPRWPFWERSPMFTEWRYSDSEPTLSEVIKESLYAAPPPAAVEWHVDWTADNRIRIHIGNQSFQIQYYPMADVDEGVTAEQRRDWYVKQLRTALSKLAGPPPAAVPVGFVEVGEVVSWDGLAEVVKLKPGIAAGSKLYTAPPPAAVPADALRWQKLIALMSEYEGEDLFPHDLRFMEDTPADQWGEKIDALLAARPDAPGEKGT